MKTLSDTLEAVIETWDDPGDYPSGAGSGPLPSYQYVEAVEGEVVVELEKDDLEALDLDPDYEADAELVRDFIINYPGEIEYDLPHGIRVTGWNVIKVDGLKALLTVDEFEAEAVEPREPEYEPEPMEWYDREGR